MSGIEQAANDLFFKLRNRFPRINMGDEGGNTTTNPTDSRFFNFDYEEDDVKFGNITASLIDNQNLKLYFSQDVTKYMDREEKVRWYKFLQEIRKFAKAHMLGLDVRDIAKDVLSQKDLQFVSNQNREKTQIGESRVLWARSGKVSEGAVGNVKVHVFHSERMDENPHNRLLRVDRIFLVNESGERFLLPFKNVMGAKAMANHVGRGGNPYDATGKLIGSAITEMTNLRRFAGATRRKTFESEDANQIIQAAQAIKESIKRSLFRIANNSRFDENIADLEKLLAEQDDVEDIKPYFMQNTYNENLDNWIGSAAKAFKQYKGNIMENLRESAGTVAQKLSDPQWKLVLKDEPAEDRLIASSKYSDGRALLRRILGTIADRVSMEDSDLANWASQIGQDMETGAASSEDMQIALQLAKRYQTDLAQIAKSPEYGKEVRVSAFGQRKDLYGKAKDESMEFEDYVDSIGEEDYEMEEDGPVIVQDPRNPLPPLTAVERLQQKLGIGAFTPPKPGPAPVNTDPLPGSPGPSQDDKDALTRMIGNEGAEEEMMDEIEADETGMGQVNEVEVDETAMDRISASVASRSTANEALDTMLWLSGVKKKSELSEDEVVDRSIDRINSIANDMKASVQTPSSTPPTPSAMNVSRDPTGPFKAPPVQTELPGTSTAPDVSLKPRVSATGTFTPGQEPAIKSAPTIEPPVRDPVGPTKSPTIEPPGRDPVGSVKAPAASAAPAASVAEPVSPASATAKPGIGRIGKGGLAGAALDAAIAAPDIYDRAKKGDYSGAAKELGTSVGQGAAYGALAAVPVVGPPLAALAGMMGSTSAIDTAPYPQVLARAGLSDPAARADYEKTYGKIGYDPANGSIVLPKGAPTPLQHQRMSTPGLANPTPTKQQTPPKASVTMDPSMFNPTPVKQQKGISDSVELNRIRTLSGIGIK
jgi:hypothetical protein